MPADFLPKTDAGLLEWLQTFAAYIFANFAAVGISEAQASDMKDTVLSLATMMATAKTPATRTTVTIQTKDTQRKLAVAMARQLVGIIQKFPALTDTQRRAMRITVPKQRAPQPALTVRPATRLTSVVGRAITVDIYDPTSATKRRKASGAADAYVYSYVGTSYPSDPTAWSFNGAAGKTRFTFTVPNSVASGAQIWICAAWVNRAGAGPTSMPISTNVQGGGANEQPVAMKIAA